MKTKIMKIITTLFAVLFIFGAIGCSKSASVDSKEKANAEEMTERQFKPADIALPRMDKYEFPYMGLALSLPETLLKQMDEKKIAMLNAEDTGKEGGYRYALLTWSKMTQEQKEAKVSMKGDGYFRWEASLARIGALGIYAADIKTEELNKLTRCDQHTVVGISADGKFKYYLSVNAAAAKEDRKLVQNIMPTIGDIKPIPRNCSAFMDLKKASASGAGGSLASLSTESIDGALFSQAEFEKYDLTMVNIFTTWCSACVQEIPDLEKLHQNAKGKGVNVVGIVADTVEGIDSSENMIENQSIIALAKKIREKTGATYPFLKPDAGLYNGRLKNIYALPDTFFVDKKGNIVGETYSGSHTYEEWKEITEKTLQLVKKA